MCPSESEGLVKFYLQPICNVSLTKFSTCLVPSKMQTHFIIFSLMLSLKDIKLPAQISCLFWIGIKYIISHSTYIHYLLPPFLNGLIWYSVTVDQRDCFYTVVLYNLHGAWHLWPQFSMTMEIPVQVQTLLQSVLIHSCWKITRFSLFSLLCLKNFSFLLQGVNLLISSATHSSMKNNWFPKSITSQHWKILWDLCHYYGVF